MKSIFKLLILTNFITIAIFNNLIKANPIDKVLNKNTQITRPLSDSTKTQTTAFQNISPPKRRFELGFELGVLMTSMEYLLDYQEFLTNAQQAHSIDIHYSMMNSFHFTHRLNKKWWIQTGFRYGRSKWSDNFLLYAYYDRSGAYIQPNGEVGYDLTLIAEGSINDVETSINVTITNASNLENNDLVASAFLLENNFNWFQVPIGLEYRFGEKRFNYFLKSGVSFNQVATTNYTIDGLIEASNSFFLINEITYQESDAKRFLEGYLGVGLRYNLKPNIAIYFNYNLRIAPAINVYYYDVFSSFYFGGSYLF